MHSSAQSAPESLNPAVETAFVEYLALAEAGEAEDFEDFCRKRPEIANELRELYADWIGADRLLSRLGASGSLGRRLERRFGGAGRLDVSLHAEEAQEDDSAAKAVDSLLGRLIGGVEPSERYRRRGEIGRGGMGTVLRVWDEHLRRQLAMKVIRTRGRGPAGVDPRTLERFLEEAQVTGQLDHPGIVPVHDLGLDADGRVYFTMKLVQGRTLEEVFDLAAREAQGWSRTRALDTLLRACEAVAYAHELGVVHRDLKPSNVMVGRFGEVYVMDWGLARVLGREDGRDPVLGQDEESDSESTDPQPLRTRDGQILGTPSYMPPEQAAGRVREVGRPADVYALGAMLYRLLAGRPPYPLQDGRSTPVAILNQVLHEAPRPLHSLRNDLPPELVSICEKAMARDPSARYPDVASLVQDLRAFQEGRVVRAHATGALVELRKWVVRNRGLASALAAAILALIGGLAVTSVLRGREALARETAQVEAGDRRAISRYLANLIAQADPRHLGREAKVIDMLNLVARDIDTTFADRPKVRAPLHNAVGKAYRALGEGQLSEEHLAQALETAEQAFPPDAPELLEIRGFRSFTQGEYDRAAAAYRALREQRSARFGAAHPDTLIATYNLARCLSFAAKHEEALGFCREAYEGMSASFGRDHWQTLAAQQVLADTLHELGREDEALALLDEVLTRWQQGKSADHPAVLSALASKAGVLSAQGRFVEAEPVLRRLIEVRRRVLGESHPRTLAALNTLGSILVRVGRRKEARTLYEELLETAREHLPEDDGELLAMQNNFAELLRLSGDFGPAQALHSSVYEWRLDKLGPDHDSTLTSLSNLALTLAENDDPADDEHAQNMMREAVRRLGATQGPHAPRTLQARNNLAQLLETRGEREEALELCRENLTGFEASLGPDDARTLTARYNLGCLLYKQGQKDEAVAHLRAAYEGFAAGQGSSSSQTRLALYNYAFVLSDLGRGREAESDLARIVAEFAPDDPNRAPYVDLLRRVRGETQDE